MYNYFKLSEQRKKNYMMGYEKVNREMVCIQAIISMYTLHRNRFL